MAWYSKHYDETGLIEVGGVHLPARSWFGKPPDNEMSEILQRMEEAERSDELDGLFSGRCQEERQQASKEKLQNAIRSDMKLYKSMFLKIYGYELSYPGYAEQALSKLEEVGCSKAREYYQRFVGEYEQKQDETMKEVAAWYRKQDSGFKRESDKGWKKQREAEQRKKQNWSELSAMLNYQQTKTASQSKL